MPNRAFAGHQADPTTPACTDAKVKFEKVLMRFVATDEEKKWALAEKARHGAAPLIMWVLAGSSIHKVWHGIDPVLARVTEVVLEAVGAEG